MQKMAAQSYKTKSAATVALVLALIFGLWQFLSETPKSEIADSQPLVVPLQNQISKFEESKKEVPMVTIVQPQPFEVTPQKTVLK